MPSYKKTWFWNNGTQGWTESWFFTGASLDAVETASFGVTAAMAACKDVESQLLGIRIQQVDPPAPRVGELFLGSTTAGTRGAGGGAAGNVNGGPDVQATCAFMRVLCADKSPRTVMIRGLADNDVIRTLDGISVPSPGLIGALVNLATVLKNTGAQVRRKDTGNAGFPVGLVQKDPTFASETGLTIGPPVPFAIGDRVRFTGVPLKELPWLKGFWQVAHTTVTSLTLGYNFPLAAPVTPQKMKVYKVGWTYSTFDNWNFVQFRTRKTGRPTFLTRGRSRGIRYRQ